MTESCNITHECAISPKKGSAVQDGEDAQDAVSSEVIFRKRALESVALLWKETCNLSHVRHPVPVQLWTKML